MRKFELLKTVTVRPFANIVRVALKSATGEQLMFEIDHATAHRLARELVEATSPKAETARD